MPSSARLSVSEEGVLVEVIALEPGVSYYNDEPTFDDESHARIELRFQLLKLVVGLKTPRHSHPSAVLHISDPYEIEESFTLSFAFHDFNNPEYAIKVLVKMLRESFGLTIEEEKEEPRQHLW